MRKGSNQTSSDIEINDRSLTASETMVSTSMLNTRPIVDGMVSKLVSTVLKLFSWTIKSYQSLSIQEGLRTQGFAGTMLNTWQAGLKESRT